MRFTNNALLVPAVDPLGSANTILLATARHHTVNDFPGPLSIKYVISGRVPWKTGGRELWVDACSFLVLNDGEPYSLDIDSHLPTETCCVFFERGFVEAIARDFQTSEDELIRNPFETAPPLNFISRLHARDEDAVPALLRLRHRARSGVSVAELETEFVVLAQKLLLLYREVRDRVRRVPAVKASTRAELLLRVERGREFLHAEKKGCITLASAARAACLSPFHFHRLFTQVFRQTPHSYVTALRLGRAVEMLRRNVPVTEVANAAGFESLGSFSTAFRKHLGFAPSRFHRNKQDRRSRNHEM